MLPSRCMHSDTDADTPSSIISWLSDQPNHPAQYENSVPVHSRKRQQPQRTANKLSRRRLGELSPNTAAPRLQDMEKTGGWESPTKRITRSKTHAEAGSRLRGPHSIDPKLYTPVHSRRGRSADQEDEEPTPKAPLPSKNLGAIPILDGAGSEKGESTQSESSTGDLESRTSNRSSSPRKARFDMQLAEVCIINTTFGAPGRELPASANGLYRAIRSIDLHRRVLPSAIRSIIKDTVEDLDEDMYYNISNDDTEDSNIHHARWQRILRVLSAARECKDGDYPESAWNSEVHSRVLRIALESSGSIEVWYKDLTSARISEKRLLPKIPGFNPKSKMVDYGIVIQPAVNSILEASIRRLCREQQLDSVNQTDPNHVRFTPIAVSMETKRAAIEEDQAILQLNTWVSAHFAKLDSLVGSYASNEKAKAEIKAKATMPILPLVKIQGHDWKLLIAEKQTDLILIHGELAIGSTQSHLGVYQILAALQRLAQWVNDEYRPWWMREILGKKE
ncbi:MAG: hypothetical protein Q9187_005033 [Circinaria calcarea]